MTAKFPIKVSHRLQPASQPLGYCLHLAERRLVTGTDCWIGFDIESDSGVIWRNQSSTHGGDANRGQHANPLCSQSRWDFR
jgi:hypothetical protein